jgi:hypothetical protein
MQMVVKNGSGGQNLEVVLFHFLEMPPAVNLTPMGSVGHQSATTGIADSFPAFITHIHFVV